MPPTPIVSHPYDPNPEITYTEVKVFHPNSTWKASGTCSILYEISDGHFDDKGTMDISDDEMSFTLTVIGQNVGDTWSTNINGNFIHGDYYKSIGVEPFLSNGSSLNFIILDNNNGSCSSSILVDANDF